MDLVCFSDVYVRSVFLRKFLLMKEYIFRKLSM